MLDVNGTIVQFDEVNSRVWRGYASHVTGHIASSYELGLISLAARSALDKELTFEPAREKERTYFNNIVRPEISWVKC